MPQANAGNIVQKVSEAEKIRRARVNINDYMEYVFDIEQADLHRQWHDFIQSKKWSMILAPQFHGKCEVGETLIQLSSGELREVRSIKKQESIISYNIKTHSFESDICSSVSSNGLHRIFEVSTKSGRTIKCTSNHPFYTFSGSWKNAELLSVNDFIPVATGVHFSPVQSTNPDHIFIGYMIGDGSCSHPPSFTNKDTSIINHFKEICNSLGIGYSTQEKIYRCTLRQPSENILKLFSLYGKNSYTKSVPSNIFRLPLHQLSEFIGAYFACDGTVDKNRLEISFSSVSKKLLEDISTLLLRFNIVSVLKLKNGTYNGRRHVSWRLSVRGDMVLLFRQNIKFKGEKNNVLDDICNKLNNRKFSRSWINVVPPEWRSYLKHTRDWYSDRSEKSSGHFGTTGNGNDIKVAKYAAWLEENDLLLQKLNAPIFWDRIVSVNILPPEETYFISVEKNRNHITNDFITHNSTQITLGIPTFGLGKNPNLRFGIVRQSEPMGHSAISAIKETIEENGRYHTVFPHVIPNKKLSWKLDRLTVVRDRTDESPSIHSMGITSAPSGRKDWLMFDDPCTYVNSISQPKQRQSIIDNSWTPFKNLLGPNGRMTYICTPYHEADLTGVLRKHKVFAGAVFAKGINRNFDPIWEEVWPRQALMDWFETEINPREFWRAFGLETVSADEQLITVDQLTALKVPFFKIPETWHKFTGVDLAIANTRRGADNKRTSIFTIAVDPETKYKYTVDIRYGKFSSPETARQIVEVSMEHKPQLIYVESNNYQYALQEWIAVSGIPGSSEASQKIQPYFTGSEKTDASIGLPGLAGECSRGMWRIPSDMEDHSGTCKCGTCQWIREFTTYPVAEFSDVLMASWMSMRAANSYSYEPQVIFIGAGGHRKRRMMYEIP